MKHQLQTSLIKTLILSSLILSTSAFADNPPPSVDVNILKTKVAPYKAAIESGTAKARTLTLKLRGANNEISYDRCKEIEKKIESQYPLSPFHAIYKDGAAFSQGCEWNEEFPSREDSLQSGMRYFFDAKNSISQMGLKGSYVLRIYKPHSSRPTFYDLPQELELLLDNNFKIVESNWRTLDKDGNSVDWDVSTINTNNDYFFHIYDGQPSGKTVPYHRAFFTSGDGLLWGGWVFRPRRSDSGKEDIISKTFEVHQKDWNNFLLIPTLWMGHFYQYNANEWTDHSNTYDVLSEVSIAETGAEVCADGSSTTGSSWVTYKPSNNQDPWTCMNVW